jgi:hypothetical protein
MVQPENPGEPISSKVLKKINEEKVRMKPGCFFVARSWFWLLVSGALFFFSVAFFSVTIHYIDLAEPSALIFSRPWLLLSALPYFFIILSILFLIFSALAYRRSRNCCRHEDWMLVGMLFFGVFVVGVSAYDAHLENRLVERMEQSQRMNAFVKTPVEFWCQPEKGTLSGIVGGELGQQAIELKSWDGRFWIVHISQEKDQKLAKRKMPIKMIGQQEAEASFMAQKVFGW